MQRLVTHENSFHEVLRKESCSGIQVGRPSPVTTDMSLRPAFESSFAMAVENGLAHFSHALPCWSCAMNSIGTCYAQADWLNTPFSWSSNEQWPWSFSISQGYDVFRGDVRNQLILAASPWLVGDLTALGGSLLFGLILILPQQLVPLLGTKQTM